MLIFYFIIDIIIIGTMQLNISQIPTLYIIGTFRYTSFKLNCLVIGGNRFCNYTENKTLVIGNPKWVNVVSWKFQQ